MVNVFILQSWRLIWKVIDNGIIYWFLWYLNLNCCATVGKDTVTEVEDSRERIKGNMAIMVADEMYTPRGSPVFTKHCLEEMTFYRRYV